MPRTAYNPTLNNVSTFANLERSSSTNSCCSVNVSDLQEEYGKYLALASTQNIGGSFKSLNVSSLEHTNSAPYDFDQNSPVYRSVEIDRSIGKTFGSFDEANSSNCRYPPGQGPICGGLERQKSVPTHCSNSLKNKSHHLKSEKGIHCLLWKVYDYPLAPCHGFCTLKIPELKKQIEAACEKLNIDFVQDSGEELEYMCEAVRGFAAIKFRIRVSCLQSSCQKVLGEKYVIEVIKCECACPSLWQLLLSELSNALNGVLKLRGVAKKQMTLFNELLSSEQDSSDERKYMLHKEDECSMLSKFLRTLEGQRVSETIVQVAEVFANMTSDLSSKKDLHKVSVGDLRILLNLLSDENNEIRRISCAIIGNLAKQKLFESINTGLKEEVFNNLIRVVNTIAEEALTSILKREAVRAVYYMHLIYTPQKGGQKDIAVKTLERCAKSRDELLQKYAKQAIEAYNFL